MTAEPVRVTLHPGEDLLLRAGTRLGDLRAAIATLTCRPELRHAPLEVDGNVVDDDQRVGERPLLPGATLCPVGGGAGRPERSDASREEHALRAAWVAATVSGPDAGELRAAGPLWAPTRRAGLPRGLRMRARPARPGIVVRRSGDLARWLVPRGPDRATPPGALVALLPVATALVLAAVLRQPTLALFALAGLVVALPQLHAARRRRAASRHHPGARGVPPGEPPWAHAVPGAAPGRRALPGPAGLMAFAVAAEQSSDGTWAAASDSVATAPSTEAGPVPGPRGAGPGGTGWPPGRPPGGRPPGRPHPGTDDRPGSPWSLARALAADGALHVRGPAAEARALARAVLAELAVRGVPVRVAGNGAGHWAWCRWLSGPALPGPALSGPARPGPALPVPAPPVPTLSGPALPVPAPPGQPAGGVCDVVVVDTDGRPADLALAQEAARAGHAVLICRPGGAPSPDDTPPWCRTRATVQHGSVRIHGPDGAAVVTPSTGVTEAWAERLGRRLAAAAWLGRLPPPFPAAHAGEVTARGGFAVGQRGPGAPAEPDPVTDPRLPRAVPLATLHGLGSAPDAALVRSRWTSPGWDVPVGKAADGAVVALDLMDHGPHLLVAGTTGSGKSELLQSLVLGLALRRSPAELALVLVDFKGGASLGPCGRLPHVVGQVTDLDPGLAGRALTGLRAELKRRETVLGRHGVADAAQLPPGTLPRLVVVIDEFRALAEDLPEFLPGLARAAAQGRALGMHLVLATQRPAGAVSADLRANLGTRLALRVVDALESRDTVDCPLAARIPVEAPGRAVLRVGSGAPVVLQCAHATGTTPAEPPAVRRAPVWGAPPEDPDPLGERLPRQAGDDSTAGPGTDSVAAIVTAVRTAAAELAHTPGPPPWLPALPTRVRADELAAHLPGYPGGTPGLRSGVRSAARLVLALGDLPAEQRRTAVTWDLRDGHLGVVGRARSGRTTTLLAVAAAALRTGRRVHAVVARRSDQALFRTLATHPRFGTLTGPYEPDTLHRLLTSLADADPRIDPRVSDSDAGVSDTGIGDTGTPGSSCAPGVTDTVVVVDGLESLRSGWSAMAPGADPLLAALAGPAAFALAAESAGLAGLVARVGPRLVLCSGDRVGDVALGVPTAYAGAGASPGRAVWLDRGHPVPCQVLLP